MLYESKMSHPITDERNDFGDTPLHTAAKWGFCEYLLLHFTAGKLLLDSVMLNNNVSYLSESLSFACWLAFTCISHAKASQQAKLKDSER